MIGRVVAAIGVLTIVATLAIGAFGSPELRGRVAEDGPACPFRAATGQPCAFCGMTHATLSLGHGELDAALTEHPLAPVVLAGMLAVFALAAAGRGDALTRGRRPALILAAVAIVWAVKLASGGA